MSGLSAMYLVIFPIFLLSNYTRNGQSDKYTKCCLYPIFGNFFCCNSLKNGDDNNVLNV